MAEAMRSMACTLAVLLAACDGGTTAPDAGGADAGPADGGADAGPPFEPDLYCPGSPGCASGSGGTLEVGAAAVTITPTIDETTDIQTVDVDGDGEFEPRDGDMYEDRDGRRGYQGVWIAGFGNARGARGVHDEQWVRAVAMRNGETTIVMAALDVIGWFKTEMDDVREMVADLDVDHVAFTATHCHECRDVVGLWGPTQDISGLDPEYNAFVRERAAEAIRQAVAALRPANVQYATLDLRDVPGGVRRYIFDIRDPIVIDPRIRVMRFLEAGSDTTIATLVNLGSHPEYLDDRNTLLSSDYPHWLRDGIENGVDGPDGEWVEGLGGIAVFYQGALGSQIGPANAEVQTWGGEAIDQRTDPMAFTAAMGSQVAYHVLGALADGGGSTTDETAALGLRTRTFFVDVQNTGFHIAISQGLFDREGENWDPTRPIIPGENEPDLLTEVTVIDVGRVQMISAPGELDPVLFLGGYDGTYTPPGVPIVDPENENPPDLSMAPSGPYLRDLARSDAEHVWLLGLTNDFLGYLIPEFDYVLDETTPYLAEAPGDHYEETNSVGIDGWPRIRSQLEALLAWRPAGD